MTNKTATPKSIQYTSAEQKAIFDTFNGYYQWTMHAGKILETQTERITAAEANIQALTQFVGNLKKSVDNLAMPAAASPEKKS